MNSTHDSADAEVLGRRWPGDRLEFLADVAQMRLEGDTAALVRVLHEANDGTAACAAEFLAAIGTPACADALLDVLDDCPELPVLR